MSVPQSRTTTRMFGASDPGRPGRPAALSAHRRPRLCPIAQARRRNGSILILPRRRERRGRGHSYDVVAFEGRAVQVDRSRQALLAREGGQSGDWSSSADQIARVVIAYRGVIQRRGRLGALGASSRSSRAMARLSVVRLRGRRPVSEAVRAVGPPAVRVGGSVIDRTDEEVLEEIERRRGRRASDRRGDDTR